MNIFHEPERIYIENPEHQIVAFITFPLVNEHTVCIDHTFVDDTEEGNGLAEQLMEEFTSYLKQSKFKASVTCPYAADWFHKHCEYVELISNHATN